MKATEIMETVNIIREIKENMKSRLSIDKNEWKNENSYFNGLFDTLAFITSKEEAKLFANSIITR